MEVCALATTTSSTSTTSTTIAGPIEPCTQRAASGYEPNDTPDAAAPAPSDTATPLELPSTDTDWFALTVEPGRMATLSAEIVTGDVDLSVHDANAICLGGRLPGTCAALDRAFETPKHLADKIRQSKSALEGERKQVTVLFADVKGSMELAEQRQSSARSSRAHCSSR